jgi:hypothetical protein
MGLTVATARSVEDSQPHGGSRNELPNRSHLTLLVNEIMSWMELEIKTSAVKYSVFLSRPNTRFLYFNTRKILTR